jgi:hypothetical protein
MALLFTPKLTRRRGEPSGDTEDEQLSWAKSLFGAFFLPKTGSCTLRLCNARNQCDQMSLLKNLPKMWPSPFFQN